VSEALRLYKYKSMLSSRRAMSAAELMAGEGISAATFKRDMAKMRDQMRMPIRFDRDLGGYILDKDSGDTELPGLWFSPDEILALVTIQQLLAQLEPGLIGTKLKPLQDRLAQMMEKNGLSSQDVAKHIRIVFAGKRRVKPRQFEAVAVATVARKRLQISHFNRQNGLTVEREISPQRLVHYRDNWYVDAWCHLRNDLRNFSIDAIRELQVLDKPAKEVTPKSIDNALGAGYGIFGGAPRAIAVLRFTKERARWVSRETWHPQQESQFEDDGSYVLSVPYSDDREIVGDIMRFGADVQVLEPAGLKAKVQKGLLEAVGRYM
jgi:predicted DNA-binding transcriptional regulator YafY